MTRIEQKQLDLLVLMSEEPNTLNDWEKEFVESLDGNYREKDLTPNQSDCFDKLVDKYLRSSR